MKNYIPTIGLEIHIEVKTRTKMFCSCQNDPNETKPNVNVCPVCLAHPGTLPAINKSAIEAIVKLGFALGGTIDRYSHFDRKSYFYPDLPKGYQISQYEHPIVKGSILKDVHITRVHMEEDTGRLVHSTNLADKRGLDTQINADNLRESTFHQRESASLVDFNRAGVPLMELVTEPEVRDANHAVAFARELQLILRYLDISDADMEKGEMRVEANISLMHTDINTNSTNNIREISDKNKISGDSRVLGTKVEVKNINSFKAVHDAIEYEIKRQKEVLESGGKVVQETRGWNNAKHITQSQRLKESAHDYRYFPEPDLPPLDMEKFGLEELRARVPELPEAKRIRFAKEFKIPKEQIEILASEKGKAEYFEEAATELKLQIANCKFQILANYFTSDLTGLMKDNNVSIRDLKISPHEFAHFVSLIEKGTLSSKLAKVLLEKMFTTGEDPETLIEQGDLKLSSDEKAIGEIIERIIKENPNAIADYKKGKQNALQFLIGKIMAETKGKAEPKLTRKLLVEKLGEI